MPQTARAKASQSPILLRETIGTIAVHQNSAYRVTGPEAERVLGFKVIRSGDAEP